MKPRKEIPLAVQVENLELANRTLKNYIQRLEEKLAKYEKMLQHCPRFRAEQQLEEDDWEDDELEDDDWDGLEESDFADDWDDDEDFDDFDDFDEFDDFDDEDDLDDDLDGYREE